MYHQPSSIVVLEDLCFQEHKYGIRRKHEEYADKVAEDHVLHNTCKRGPLDRPNRPTRPRHRHTNIRTHRADTQRKTVARGAKVGPAEPTLVPGQVHFGRKSTLILQKAVANISMFILAGTDIKGL